LEGATLAGGAAKAGTVRRAMVMSRMAQRANIRDPREIALSTPRHFTMLPVVLQTHEEALRIVEQPVRLHGIKRAATAGPAK